MRRIVTIAGVCTLLWSYLAVAPVAAASVFASPAFQQQWQQGEAITQNFWGPLATAKDGQQEPYKEAQGGQRLVQYFDKGRMELTNGKVTNGLLVAEMIKGKIQTGDNTFQPQTPPAIAIAGDPDNSGPTYVNLASKGSSLFDAAPARVGNATQAVVSATGDVSAGNASPSAPTTFALYDDATKHNVPKAFADYRATASLSAIGYALCDPFFTTVKVAGAPKQVMVQVFERRLLTYTATNPAGFQVEMGNVGRHYYQWRGASPAAPPAAVSSTALSPPVTTTTPTLNWTGYEIDTKNVTAIHAAWVIPSVTAPPTTGYSATWIGIGGSVTDDLIQAGTVQQIENGVTTYIAFVEALPDDPLSTSSRRLSAHPGDVFSVTITNTSGNNWSVTLENRTTSQQATLTTTYTSCRCSAEWIEEVPQVDGNNNAPLANFGTVSFTEATATVNGTTRSVASLGAQPLVLMPGDKVLAQPRALGPDGQSFSISYVR